MENDDARFLKFQRLIEQVKDINATLEMQAKRDQAEIAMLKTRLRSLAGKKRKRKCETCEHQLVDKYGKFRDQYQSDSGKFCGACDPTHSKWEPKRERRLTSRVGR